jgi:carbamoyltransferase
MNILGIHVGHDSSAALVQNGKIVAHVAEERLSRRKHHNSFPYRAIALCLRQAGLSAAELDVIAIAGARTPDDINYFFGLDGTPREAERAAKAVIKKILSRAGRGLEKPPIYLPRFPAEKSVEIFPVEHHLAHAASAYYTCGSAEAQLVVTMDGLGDHTAVAIWRGESGRLTLLKRFDHRGSLGWFYGNVTEALGWWHGDGEGKTMGLAAYGDPDRARGTLEEFYPKYANGDLVEPHDYGTAYFWNEAGANEYHFDEAYRIRAIAEKYGTEHTAAEAQRILEEQAGGIIKAWLDKERLANLCCAGGIFLNVKLNQSVWDSGKVVNHHIFPDAGDAGLSIGAALHAYHTMNPGAPIQHLDNVYWGPEFTNEQIREILDSRNLTYEYHDDVADATARLLADGKIVAWFQGRMESGPRALGARSILMSPTDARNKDIINAQVKFRESFRPFCPSILADKAQLYISNFRPEPFMITSFAARKEKMARIPAVVHVDGTLRPQTVEQTTNERYWKLISAFGSRTGEYVLLNTSLNIKNEPIVCSPSEAIRCFYDTGLHNLVIGNFILKK